VSEFQIKGTGCESGSRVLSLCYAVGISTNKLCHFALGILVYQHKSILNHHI